VDEKDISAEDTSSVVEKEEDVVAEDVESLKKALAEEKAKAEGYLANWQRAQADFINFKRRMEQERSETAKAANAMLMLNLLPVLDDLERALESVSVKLAGLTWVDGIHLIYRKLLAILEGYGLSEIKALGEPFDPNLHEAVLYGEGEEGKVIEELQKGYKLYDRVIRPAMVKVGKAKEETAEEKRQEEKNGEGNRY
jgi:molecular chaperone GrpE